ncbi:acyltransferase family protein [Pseudomonas sp. GM55]|jgi:peptidoglycan/LPS O-acetylase OafA/YrhL|uniref:acyltransferase family protein n=1 Tax=Pseudomonas sp. GM55 TaxID=1144333 RepID=UPI00027087DB|nr:acyltransferase family protein [Pseudomonas sp. GM55]EJM69387.1 putative acyltransferase [Pseudomonas sp. GM55]
MTSLAEPASPLLTQTTHSTKYRPDIDGLRAIAVLSVVGFHAFPVWVTGGFIGVDIFFVISGYLITTILLEGLARGKFSIPEFYARRVNRIFPALLTVMIASYAFGWLTLFPDEFQQLGKHLAGGSAFISNLVLWNESGYFDTSAEIKPLLHLWSLGIEEQYYIFWPVIMWAAWKKQFNLLTIAVLLLGASFALNMESIRENPTFTFYMPQTRCWELLIGSVLAYLSLYKISVFDKAFEATDRFLATIIHKPVPVADGHTIRNVLSFIGLGLIAYGLATITKDDQFPGWRAIFPTVGTALIIAAGSRSWLNRSILSNKLMVWVGLISFPLYLWHWPLLAFARIIQGDVPSRDIRIAAVFTAIILAWLTYRFLERPLRNNQSKFKTPILVILMASIGGVGFATFNLGGLPERKAVKGAEEFNSQFVGPIWKFTKNDICINRYQFKEAESYGWWFCITNRDEKPTLLLLGNSYANHLFPGLAAEDKIKNQTILSIGACAPNMGDPSDENTPTTIVPCSGSRAYHQKLLINSIIEKDKTIKYAILDGLDPRPDSKAITTIEERIAYLESNGIKVIVFVPHITANHDLKGCFSRPLKSGPASCDISPQARETALNDFKPLADEISSKHPTVQFFDQNELFCNFLGCSFIKNGMPLFRDEYSHYSEYASTELAKIFVKWAEKNAPGILEK